MEGATSRRQKAIITALLVVGFLGIGFLVYIVADHLTSDAPPSPAAIDPVNEAANETSDPSAVVRADVPVGIRINQRAPDFLLQSLDNESVALSDFLGKVVILDFWASWCGPCKTTMPGLESLARALSPDVVLLGVSLDQVAANATSYLASNHFDAMIALYESYAAAYAVFQTYGGGGIPKTYVIDRTGIIRYVGHPASLSRQTVERLI